MIIQIYAFTNIEEAQQAVEFGINQIGFIAGRYGEVHAELDFSEAAALAKSLPEEVKASALTMATEVQEILQMAEQVEPDIVHISSDMWAVDPAMMRQLRSSLPTDIQLMKAIAVDDRGSLENARAFYEVTDLLLLDTKVKGMPGVGATGRTHDWEISRLIVEDSPVPVILAGGLTSDNVAEAIRQVRPAGVDSNTGTNLTGDPVVKDMDKVEAFAREARKAYEDLP